MKAATFIVPGYIGNQRIEATRRQRRRRLVNLFWLGAALALAAASLCAIPGCGGLPESDVTMQSEVVEIPLFEVSPAFASTAGKSARVQIELPGGSVRYSVECFARVKPGTQPGTYPFSIWTDTPGKSPVQWWLYPAAEPGGTLYPAIRGTYGVPRDCPDAWEDDGTAARVIYADVLLTPSYPWLQNDGYPTGVPSLTILMRVTFSPGPGKCFTDAQWRAIADAAKATLLRSGPVPQVNAL